MKYMKLWMDWKCVDVLGAKNNVDECDDDALVGVELKRAGTIAARAN